MFAIYDRDVRGTGKGQYIDLAIYEPIFALLGPQPIIFDQLGVDPEPHRQPFGQQRAAQRLSHPRRSLGRAFGRRAEHRPPRARTDRAARKPPTIPRFQTNLDRVRHVEAIDAIVGGWIAERDLARGRRDLREGRGGDRAGLRHRADLSRPAVPRARVDHDGRGRRSRPGAHAERLSAPLADARIDPVRWRPHRPASRRDPGRIASARGSARRRPHRERKLVTEPCPPAAPLRDLVGYADKRPNPRWPGGARIAVQFALNYEEGSEYSVADGDGRTELGLAEAPGGRVPAGQRDLAFETMYEFGSRVGVWRLFRLFAERGLPLTVFGCAVALERNPRVAEAIARSGLRRLLPRLALGRAFQPERGRRARADRAGGRVDQAHDRRASARLVLPLRAEREYAPSARRGGRLSLQFRRLQRRAALLGRGRRQAASRRALHDGRQ